MATTNLIIIAGEVKSLGKIKTNEIEAIARKTVKGIGYNLEDFNWEDVEIRIYIHDQSPDIAMGVDSKDDNKSEGAGDQGIMFGYACNETPELMPAPILYSHKILEVLAKKRHSGQVKGILPDSKSQITLYYEAGIPKFVDSIVISTQHIEGVTRNYLKDILQGIIGDVLPYGWFTDKTKLLINPTGNFVIGGPAGDTGLTGRKIIVDTYGGAAPHGGGAFSGKDPTKVDRSAAYIARYLAKNIVAAGISGECTIQLSYAIGISEPLSLYVKTDNTSIVEESVISDFIRENIDLTPRGIMNYLNLNKPIYSKTSAYGHFGRDPGDDGTFSWEKIDLAKTLKNELL
ncbi:uncharacterized protein METZ01_LOCUS2491 [marine metagenome]|uniref:methionine adenosyltransferase n=1 Tax=marine metagenome TaxID=408172 RepID=A0A381N554_9ZZZZ